MAEKNGDFDGAKLEETEVPDFTAGMDLILEITASVALVLMVGSK